MDSTSKLSTKRVLGSTMSFNKLKIKFWNINIIETRKIDLHGTAFKLVALHHQKQSG